MSKTPVSAPSPSQSLWWQLRLTIRPEQEDVVFWRLEQFGCKGMASEVQNEHLQIRAYIPIGQATWLDLAALSLHLRQDAILSGMTPPLLKWERLESEDWASSWKQYWQPQEIGDHLLICPAWMTPPDTQRHILRMDPGMAFGTGTHPTTQLCLEALEMRLDSFGGPTLHLTVADVGCGSGILSLAAAKLGAVKVHAVDMDPLAVQATAYNCHQNHMGGIVSVAEGSLEKIPEMVDGLVCNILADTILDMIPEFRLVVKEKGWLILSGILLDQAKIVSETLEANNWTVATLWKRQEWCCLNARTQ